MTVSLITVTTNDQAYSDQFFSFERELRGERPFANHLPGICRD